MTPSMTEAEAREIVEASKILKGGDYGTTRFAEGFLAGIAHERARAERLVELLRKNLERMKLISVEDLECIFGDTGRCPNHGLIHETEEALSAYNQERGEKEGKA